MSTSESELEPEDPIRQAAAAALADVDALEASGDDRSILLKALLEARLPRPNGFSPLPLPVASVQAPPVSPGAPPSTQHVEAGDVLGHICAALKVDRDLIDLVYTLQDGEPHIVVSPKRIATNKAQATRHLAQLVAASRQAAGLEEWTSVTSIRKVVTDYGRLDSGNFASYLQNLDGVALLRGKGQQREIKITKPGYEATGDLVRALVGTD
ncbi:hypothetical protein [Mycobacterium sp. NPDC006124]|uniref:hypothetical protein n=1 Tax=Mycobacterium sp. NPDC006124 TaxID=3156729 RepID=UPI0033A65560